MVVGATAGFRVNVAERVTPPPETEMVTSVCALTGTVVIMTPPVVLPAGIRTEFESLGHRRIAAGDLEHLVGGGRRSHGDRGERTAGAGD